MKKTIIAIALVLLMAAPVFATRIGVTYNDVDYILNTSVPVTAADSAYFSGMYDALVCVKEARQLYEIHQVIQKKSFLDAEGKAVDPAQKASYVAAFKDFMEHYTAGSMGEFSDIYPIYDAVMQKTPSYSNAKLIVEFGQARFYLRNL